MWGTVLGWGLKLIGAGGASDLLRTGGEVAGNIVRDVFGSKFERERWGHDENISVQQSYAAEFQYRGNRTWFDSLVDGLNRLPRPIMAFSAIGVLYWCPIDPAGFSLAMQAFSLVPEWLWGLIITVICFYFGGRLVTQDLKPKPMDTKQVQQVQQLQAEKGFAKEMADRTRPMSNAAIAEWNRRRGKP